MTNLEAVLKYLKDNLGIVFSSDEKVSSNLMDMLNRYIPSGLVTLAKASDSTPLACSSEGKPANKKLSEILVILENSGFKIVATCDFMNKYRIVVDYDKQP